MREENIFQYFAGKKVCPIAPKKRYKLIDINLITFFEKYDVHLMGIKIFYECKVIRTLKFFELHEHQIY